MTECQCAAPGWCQRHAVMKSHRWWELCRTDEAYFQAWEDGHGPGQHVPLDRRVPKRIPLDVPIITEGRIDFITLAQLGKDSVTLASMLPSDVDAIVAVPRSGMIPASIVACMLHLPLLTIVGGVLTPCGSGCRLPCKGVHPRRLAFIDDTLAGGSAQRRLIEDGLLVGDHVHAVVYSSVEHGPHLYVKHLPFPHLLEWNLFNSGYITSIATDMDGILCQNPPHGDTLLYTPRKQPIKAIITARPTTERLATIKWLDAHGVQYNRLYMWPHKTPATDSSALALWKSKMVRESGSEWYIESEPGLADMIRTHGVRVLCPRQGYLV